MRVANIIEEGRLGGPQLRMIRVAKAMPTVETKMVMPHLNSDEFQSLCTNAGVSWKALPITRITKDWPVALRYVLFTPFEIIRLALFLRRERIELVHASGGSWQYKAVIAAKLSGIPSIWHLNDTSAPRWIRKLFQLLSPLPAGYIFASHRSRDYYAKYIRSHVPYAIVSSTVDLTSFHPRLVSARIEGRPLRIGTVANVTPVKGLDVLIRAVAVAQAEHPELEVIVAGAQTDNHRAYFKELRVLADDLGARINWLGPIADVPSLLSDLDVYVCSSMSESSPASVWEAMAMACPVVSTDVGDVAMHVTDGVHGYVVPVADATGLAVKIGQLLADPVARRRMGLAAQNASTAFGLDAVARKTENFYRDVVKRSGSSDTKEVN